MREIRETILAGALLRASTRKAHLVLCVGVGVILVAALLRAHGAEQPPRAGVAVPASVFSERPATGYSSEHGYDSYFAEPHKQIQEEVEKKQEPVFPDRIPLRFDGILCHALSVFTLLLSVMP